MLSQIIHMTNQVMQQISLNIKKAIYLEVQTLKMLRTLKEKTKRIY